MVLYASETASTTVSLNPEPTDNRLLSRLLKEAAGVAFDEEYAAIAELQRDRTVHLTRIVLRRLLEDKDVETLSQAATPHLAICSFCCGMLQQALELIAASSTHSGYALLQDAETLAKWEQAGKIATSSAHAKLRADGIGHVYGKGNHVYRRRPDGSEELVHKGGKPAK